jgi:hypothetical protein
MKSFSFNQPSIPLLIHRRVFSSMSMLTIWGLVTEQSCYFL